MKNKTTLTGELANSFCEFVRTGTVPWVRITEYYWAKIETGGSFGRAVKVIQSKSNCSLTMDVGVYGCQPSDGTSDAFEPTVATGAMADAINKSLDIIYNGTPQEFTTMALPRYRVKDIIEQLLLAATVRTGDQFMRGGVPHTVTRVDDCVWAKTKYGTDLECNLARYPDQWMNEAATGRVHCLPRNAASADGAGDGNNDPKVGDPKIGDIFEGVPEWRGIPVRFTIVGDGGDKWFIRADDGATEQSKMGLLADLNYETVRRVTRISKHIDAAVPLTEKRVEEIVHAVLAREFRSRVRK